jgi:hypothetical protein
MTWVQKLIDTMCDKFCAIKHSSSSIRVGNHTIRVVDHDPLFEIKIFDLDRMTPPQEINDLFYDDLESHLENTLKNIQ